MCRIRTMHSLRLHLLALAAAPLLLAQAPPTPPANDPVGSQLFAPELITANAAILSLSEPQQEKLRAAGVGLRERFAELGATLREVSAALGKLIEQGADPAAIMQQFEKVQDADREVKREQLKTLLELRNILNEEQRAWLTEIKQQQAAQLRERGEKVKAAATKLREVEAQLGEALKMIEAPR